LLAPLIDPGAIHARLDAVAVLAQDRAAATACAKRSTACATWSGSPGAPLWPRHTAGAGRAARFDPAARRRARSGGRLEARERASLLEEAAGFDLLADLGDELARALVERPPAQARTASDPAGYDKELDELTDARDAARPISRAAEPRARAHRHHIAQGSAKQSLRYYIEITNPHKHRVPADYERRQTLTGAERYITPS